MIRNLISGSKGFGNTPISKENIGHKVLDIIDKAVNITDQRDEVMKMCLATSEVGDYQAVEVQGQPLQPSTMQASQTMKISQRSLGTSFMAGKKHVPGRAGGGWESSEDENYGSASFRFSSLEAQNKVNLTILG